MSWFGLLLREILVALGFLGGERAGKVAQAAVDQGASKDAVIKTEAQRAQTDEHVARDSDDDLDRELQQWTRPGGSD